MTKLEDFLNEEEVLTPYEDGIKALEAILKNLKSTDSKRFYDIKTTQSGKEVTLKFKFKQIDFAGKKYIPIEYEVYFLRHV